MILLLLRNTWYFVSVSVYYLQFFFFVYYEKKIKLFREYITTLFNIFTLRRFNEALEINHAYSFYESNMSLTMQISEIYA